MFLTDNEAHAALDALFSGGPTRWLGLSTTEPTLTGGGYTNITEPAAGSYARVQVLPSEWVTANRATQAEVVFPDPVDDLGVVVAWVLFDAATGGAAGVAGVPAEPMDLESGVSNVTVVCRIESPANLITI